MCHVDRRWKARLPLTSFGFVKFLDNNNFLRPFYYNFLTKKSELQKPADLVSGSSSGSVVGAQDTDHEQDLNQVMVGTYM